MEPAEQKNPLLVFIDGFLKDLIDSLREFNEREKISDNVKNLIGTLGSILDSIEKINTENTLNDLQEGKFDELKTIRTTFGTNKKLLFDSIGLDPETTIPKSAGGLLALIQQAKIKDQDVCDLLSNFVTILKKRIWGGEVENNKSLLEKELEIIITSIVKKKIAEKYGRLLSHVGKYVPTATVINHMKELLNIKDEVTAKNHVDFLKEVLTKFLVEPINKKLDQFKIEEEERIARENERKKREEEIQKKIAEMKEMKSMMSEISKQIDECRSAVDKKDNATVDLESLCSLIQGIDESLSGKLESEKKLQETLKENLEKILLKIDLAIKNPAQDYLNNDLIELVRDLQGRSLNISSEKEGKEIINNLQEIIKPPKIEVFLGIKPPQKVQSTEDKSLVGSIIDGTKSMATSTAGYLKSFFYTPESPPPPSERIPEEEKIAAKFEEIKPLTVGNKTDLLTKLKPFLNEKITATKKMIKNSEKIIKDFKENIDTSKKTSQYLQKQEEFKKSIFEQKEEVEKICDNQLTKLNELKDNITVLKNKIDEYINAWFFSRLIRMILRTESYKAFLKKDTIIESREKIESALKKHQETKETIRQIPVLELGKWAQKPIEKEKLVLEKEKKEIADLEEKVEKSEKNVLKKKTSPKPSK